MARKRTGIIERKKSITIEFSYKRKWCRETIKIPPTPSNLKFAERKRAQILLEIGTGVFNYYKHFPDSLTAHYFGHGPTSMPLGKAIDRWTSLRITKASTKTQHNVYKKVILDYFDQNRDLKSIRQSDIDLFIVNISGKMAPSTARNYISMLKGTFTMAFEDGFLDKKLRFNMPKNRVSRKIDPFTHQEIDSLIKVLPERWKYFVIFNIETGLRTGEMFALRWEDVDWHRRQIIVKHSIYKGQLVSTKTNRDRTVDLTNTAFDVLKKAKHLVCEFIFLNHNNKRFETTNGIQYSWKTFLKKAEVKYRPPYMLRHTYASRLLSAGVHPRYVADQMGHASTTMVEKYYYAWIEKARPDIDAMLEKAFGKHQ